jgi:hypothetical protein
MPQKQKTETALYLNSNFISHSTYWNFTTKLIAVLTRLWEVNQEDRI